MHDPLRALGSGDTGQARIALHRPSAATHWRPLLPHRKRHKKSHCGHPEVAVVHTQPVQQGRFSASRLRGALEHAAAQRLEQVHLAHRLLQCGLHLPQFGTQQTALRIQHGQVALHPGVITQLRQLQILA